MKAKLSIVAMVAVLLSLLVPVGVPAQEQVTLRFSDWHLTEDVWNKSLTEAMAIFEEQHPNIKVEMEPVSYGEKETKYTVESEAGAAPDVFHLAAFSFRSFFEKGYALPLDDFVAAEGPGFLDPWYETALDICSYEGQLMCMPGDYMAMVLIYNTKLFEEAGLDPDDPPETWDEFLEYAQALTKDTDGDGTIDQWGFGMVGAKDPGFPLRFNSVIWTFGADFLTPDLEHSALDSPEALEAFTFYTELYTKGLVPPGATTANPQDVRTQMAHEKVAMKIGSGWTAPIVDGINPDLNAFEVLRAAPVPYKTDKVTTAWLSGWFISPTSKHPEEAWELVKFITSKEMEEKWFREDRVTSSRKDVSEEYPELLEDKFAKVIGGQLPTARFEPQIAEWPEIIDALTTALHEAMIEAKTPQQALADVHEVINEILAR